ncbi:hypothetical protein Pdw03_0213 [Penicillium digitatum]|uniref:Ankyrin repeat protein n=3 Tax=Penicillium digitatum TaxID=36651 RepID=K9FUI2_PEND2|nr:hypothetical protein PDIP_17160 [Penicillium digitatum Pd1]EKV12197.1 hypothetical protein PDIG_45220 [Penicillium digitatum PHI26]EKV20357.1 hypothetical protein PDIP_17160 [Penicillium digitatum Pd1]QQK45315.1 hypothetical protein Pdw03_0213 [Penicillium digitatum]
MVGFNEKWLESWGPAVWGVIFDRLQSGNVKGGVLQVAWPSKVDNKTAAQQIRWATKLPLAQLPQKALEIIFDRMVGFSVGVRYMEEKKIHALHGLVGHNGPLKASVEKWLRRAGTVEKWKELIRSYANYEDAMGHLSDCTTFPRETDNHPFKTHPAYNAALQCSACLEFLVKFGIVTPNGYDLSGRSWLEAGLNGPNLDLLTYIVSNADPPHLVKPRDIREPCENHILLSLVGVGAFPQFVIALNRLRQARLVPIEELRTIFHEAAMHEFCAVAPVPVAEALYQHGINIGNVEHQYHELGGQLESSWHIAAAFNPAGADFMDWLDKFSMLNAEVRNAENMNPLMYAACFDEPAAIDWLCQKCDPTQPRLDGGPQGDALICAARSSSLHSGEIFSIILSHLPDRLFDNERGKIFGTEIAEGLASHKRMLADGRATDPTQNVMELLAVRKMQALVRRLSRFWPGSEWHLALEAFIRDSDLSVLRHSIGTGTRRLRSSSRDTSRPRRSGRYPQSPQLRRLSELDVLRMHEDGAGTSAARAEAMRRNRPSRITGRSGGRQILGPVRDSSNLITKAVRRGGSNRRS